MKRDCGRMSSACAGFAQSRWSRRALLRVTCGALAGSSLCPSARGKTTTPRETPRARAAIFLYQFGGPSHLDSLDMKPDAAEAIRGELRPISTKVPGIQVCDLLP